MKNKVTLLPLISLMVFSASLPACMSSRREEELQGNIKALEIKLLEVEKQILTRDRNIDVMKSSTDDANRRVQSTKGDMDEFRRQLSLTQGAIDELRVKITRLQENSSSSTSIKEENAGPGPVLNSGLSDETISALERRLARLELAAANYLNKDTHEKPKSPVKFKSAAEAQKTIAAAQGQKDYKKVIQLSTALMASDAPADQQEIALVYRGEAHFHLQQFEKAALDLTDYLEKYPRGEKRNRALLFTGDSFFYLKQSKAAKSFYAECVRTHPEKEECKAAKDRLDKMGG